MSKLDSAGTPLAFYHGVEDLFGFTFDLDAAATYQNKMTTNFYSCELSGLVNDWLGNTWVNPPYSNTAPWVEKALAEYTAGRITNVVFLLRADPSLIYFHRLAHFADLYFITGRITFNDERGKPFPDPFRFGSLLAHVYPGRAWGVTTPQFLRWQTVTRYRADATLSRVLPLDKP